MESCLVVPATVKTVGDFRNALCLFKDDVEITIDLGLILSLGQEDFSESLEVVCSYETRCDEVSRIYLAPVLKSEEAVCNEDLDDYDKLAFGCNI
jgi:hypothetical protein